MNLLNININITNNELEYKMYRKSTYTDTIIPKDPFHHETAKIFAFNSMVHRLEKIPSENTAREEEIRTIKIIATNNNYDETLIDNIIKEMKIKRNRRDKSKENGEEYRAITFGDYDPHKINNIKKI